jgi:hypothetical protein
MATSKTEADQVQADQIEADQIERVTDVEDDDDNISVRSEALGDDLPDGYFRSWRFLLLVIVSANT